MPCRTRSRTCSRASWARQSRMTSHLPLSRLPQVCMHAQPRHMHCTQLVIELTLRYALDDAAAPTCRRDVQETSHRSR